MISMIEEYFVIYDKDNDVYMERYDWGDGEVDEDSYSHPNQVINYPTYEDADAAREEYSNADDLMVVRVTVTYQVEECQM
ncbi:hypothetical protein HNQ56_003759 [Anaerotaenia torta]|uniref:hypothetical protein n=1 Tax=Anaerotaenia torta TaxID=433293 RepID=UPI003D2490B3